VDLDQAGGAEAVEVGGLGQHLGTATAALNMSCAISKALPSI
jgi:hypothetical protein